LRARRASLAVFADPEDSGMQKVASKSNSDFN
jgi:hypothetical protein